ncbi:MAG: DUF1254 domain-containing protein [Terricaulis silvestris]
MSGWGKYALGALIVAIIAHLITVNMLPGIAMNTAMDRVGGHGLKLNQWTLSDRVSEDSRAIVRPSPDFAYSACVYDLSHGPVRIAVAPWSAYWSLSLYGDNSDNYFVLDDREAHDGAEITLIRAGSEPPEHAAQPVESPSTRGIAIIRRLAPTVQAYDDARTASHDDACEPYHEPPPRP